MESIFCLTGTLCILINSINERAGYFYSGDILLLVFITGRIIKFIDSNNNVVVNYTYDSWGNLQSIGGSLAGTLGKKNPFRYRGYYFDAETGMYYLQSRYYNPEIGRFISRDDAQYHEGDTGIKANLYAYCDNNPVIGYDPTGHLTIRRSWLAFGLDVILTIIAPAFSGPLDVFGRILSAYAKRKNITLIWNTLLKGIVPRFKGLFTRLFTAIRKAIWRVTGSLISNSSTSLIGTSIGNIVKLFRNAKWNRMFDFISCFFSAGSMIAGFLDWSDGRFDGRVRI